MIWNDRLPTKEGEYVYIDLYSPNHNPTERWEAEVYRKDIHFDNVISVLEAGGQNDYRVLLYKALKNSVDDPLASQIITGIEKDHLIFKNVLHVKFEDGEEYPLFELSKEDGISLWAKVV